MGAESAAALFTSTPGRGLQLILRQIQMTNANNPAPTVLQAHSSRSISLRDLWGAFGANAGFWNNVTPGAIVGGGHCAAGGAAE